MFTTTHGSRAAIDTVISELTDGARSGYGEAPAIDYYGVSADSLVAAFESIRTLVERTPLDEIAADDWSPPEVDGAHRFAWAAVNEAAVDLSARRQGRRVWQMLGGDSVAGLVSCYTLGRDSPEAMIEKLSEFPRFPAYKVKVTGPGDLAILEALRGHTAAPFRVDANGAWTVEQALAILPHLGALGVELLEQPLPRGREAEMEPILAASPVPVIADESCHGEADLSACAGRFHGVNVKLTKCGGIGPARRLVTAARRRGMSVMVGCMTESTVGISAAAQLAPLADWLDLDGAFLLAEDTADGVILHADGSLAFPDRPGTGVSLSRG